MTRVKPRLAASAAALAAGLAGASAGMAQEGAHTLGEPGPAGQSVEIIHHVNALTAIGDFEPDADQACREAYDDWIGDDVVTIYDIDSDAGRMTARSQINEVDVRLYPLGLTGVYAFMSDDIPEALAEQNVIRVIFHISHDYTEAQAGLLLSLNETTNCLLQD